MEALDLRSLEPVEDLVVAAVRQHDPHARFRPLGQAAALRRLGEPEVHGPWIVQDQAVLDAQVVHLGLALLVPLQDLRRRAEEDVEAACSGTPPSAALTTPGDEG